MNEHIEHDPHHLQDLLTTMQAEGRMATFRLGANGETLQLQLPEALSRQAFYRCLEIKGIALPSENIETDEASSALTIPFTNLREVDIATLLTQLDDTIGEFTARS